MKNGGKEMKADDKVDYEDNEEPEKYTYFEEVYDRVRVLQEAVEEIQLALKQHDIHFTDKKYPDMDIDREVCERLDDEKI
ncbi:MAG: hypothetical protein GF315_09790 [candidate division Zixibacteria bacterium]|nr:hypothetical protein [candidate division Zixibacteria bacterium]